MSLHILIIDDEPHLPHQFARYLRKHGYEVSTAADGEAGLYLLKKDSIDLVLLDVRLPKMGGLEVLREIHKSEPELPVIMITAHGDIQTAVTAMKLGASDYLLKGFDLEELLLVFSSWWQQRGQNECACPGRDESRSGTGNEGWCLSG